MSARRNISDHAPDPRVLAVLDYLSAQQVSRIPAIKALASSLNLSPSRFRSIFADHAGMPFSRYVKQLRMHQARVLLQETMLSVKQVMTTVGLTDHSHFARDYKREFGESPSKTRRSFSEMTVKTALGGHRTVRSATNNRVSC